MRYKKVRRVIRAAGVHVHAVLAACAVRYRDCCPALARENILQYGANKRRKRQSAAAIKCGPHKHSRGLICSY
jgi:hypothetical protein